LYKLLLLAVKIGCIIHHKVPPNLCHCSKLLFQHSFGFVWFEVDLATKEYEECMVLGIV
jgi:hypothetical protein